MSAKEQDADFRVFADLLLILAGIACLVLAVRGLHPGPAATLGGALLARAGFNVGRRNP